MKNQIASIELYAIVSELQILLNSKLDKIYHPSKPELLLQFHVPNVGKRLLRIVSGKYMYLTDFKVSSDKPTGFCVSLRKYLTNARLRKVEQKEFERICEFVFEKSVDEVFSLFIEFFGKGNIVLVRNGVIVLTLFPKIWKDRVLKVGEVYAYPQREYNLLDFNEDELKHMISETDKESIVKALALDLGLGGVYAEDICTEANVDKDKKPSLVKNVGGIFKAIERLKKEKPKGFVYKNDVVPYELMQYKSLLHKEFLSYNEALNEVISSDLKEQINSLKNKDYDSQVERYNAIIKNQTKTINSLTAKENDARSKAEAIYQNYQTVSEILTEIKKAVSKFGWEHVKEKLKGHKIIKDVNPKERSVVIEL